MNSQDAVSRATMKAPDKRSIPWRTWVSSDMRQALGEDAAAMRCVLQVLHMHHVRHNYDDMPIDILMEPSNKASVISTENIPQGQTMLPPMRSEGQQASHEVPAPAPRSNRGSRDHSGPIRIGGASRGGCAGLCGRSRGRGRRRRTPQKAKEGSAACSYTTTEEDALVLRSARMESACTRHRGDTPSIVLNMDLDRGGIHASFLGDPSSSCE